MNRSGKRGTRKQYTVGQADMQPGERRLVMVDGKCIGIFNVDGEYFALHNRCPHMAGNLCEGPITGTTLQTSTTEFVYGLAGEIVRCAWHGWEFNIKTGQCLVNPRMRARTYPVTVENNQLVVHI